MNYNKITISFHHKDKGSNPATANFIIKAQQYSKILNELDGTAQP